MTNGMKNNIKSPYSYKVYDISTYSYEGYYEEFE